VSARLDDRVGAFLSEYAPASVLVVGDAFDGALAAAELEEDALTRLAVDEAAGRLPALGRFDCALVAGVTEALPAREAAELIGRLKNLHAPRFLVLADLVRSSLGRDALLALALRPAGALEDDLALWLYDVDRYNPERDWNNPDDWAHPENFDKYRG
jgi:hypothetical protein